MEFVLIMECMNPFEDEFQEGMKVTYFPKGEHGMIKRMDGDYAFVVYKCRDDWEHFRDYTAARTELSDLIRGWVRE
jgi:hypothetical protein